MTAAAAAAVIIADVAAVYQGCGDLIIHHRIVGDLDREVGWSLAKSLCPRRLSEQYVCINI